MHRRGQDPTKFFSTDPGQGSRVTTLSLQHLHIGTHHGDGRSNPNGPTRLMEVLIRNVSTRGDGKLASRVLTAGQNKLHHPVP